MVWTKDRIRLRARIGGRSCGSAIEDFSDSVENAEAPAAKGTILSASASGMNTGGGWIVLCGGYRELCGFALACAAVEFAEGLFGAGRAVTVADGGFVWVDGFRRDEPLVFLPNLFADATLNNHLYFLPGFLPEFCRRKSMAHAKYTANTAHLYKSFGCLGL